MRMGARTFGHSLIVDPWGRIVAEGGADPGLIVAEVDPAQVAAARSRIPSLLHGRRFELIEPMAEPTHLHAVREPVMIRYALNCEQGHTSRAGSRTRPPTTSRPSAVWSRAHSAAPPRWKKPSWRRGCRAPTPKLPSVPMPPVPQFAGSQLPVPMSANAPLAVMSPPERELRKKLKELREHITKNADYVGQRFPEQARKIHYGEIEHRSIYGEASPDESQGIARRGHRISPAGRFCPTSLIRRRDLAVDNHSALKVTWLVSLIDALGYRTLSRVLAVPVSFFHPVRVLPQDAEIFVIPDVAPHAEPFVKFRRKGLSVCGLRYETP